MTVPVNNWAGLTVAEILALCATDFAEVGMIDEPPGKLRAIEFPCHAAGGGRKVVLEFDYDSSLFSSARSWPRALVEGRTVVRVRSPGSDAPASDR
jgi:hypothetical protein